MKCVPYGQRIVVQGAEKHAWEGRVAHAQIGIATGLDEGCGPVKN